MIDIRDFGDIIQRDLKARRVKGQGKRVIVEFEDCWIKNDNQDIMARYPYGDAKGFNEAISDYCKKISGKVLVYEKRDGDNVDRREFGIPELSYSP